MDTRARRFGEFGLCLGLGHEAQPALAVALNVARGGDLGVGRGRLVEGDGGADLVGGER